ncbi:TIGR03943 family protein [Cohnella pontilimi]|uniref:TIGR03943 family protein n=1 Tax=Cohnella pontilimi TaxID=2564100 RepID=A0A4U0F9M2_9BACL|nr:TIGR03943 family protein [Cohnella pontilimi]TJY40784.1 TIGR03943 family protein [Cohnella pontilimi]
MSRFLILFGFALMFTLIHVEGNLNKYINTKYAYLSFTAIALLFILSAFEFVRFYRQEKEAEARKQAAVGEMGSEHEHDHAHHDHAQHDHVHHVHSLHAHEHHGHEHADPYGHDHGHSHDGGPRWQKMLSVVILIVPIFTGIFLPVQTLDSSFVKAKGFAFKGIDVSADNPGQHQFLKPDTSVYYGSDGYEEVKNQEHSEFAGLKEIQLTDQNYLKGLEVIYNYPGEFMGRTVSFDGFAYIGEQADDRHYFVFRFGFIHCAADSGVFGMLAEFPKNTVLQNDEWVHVSGTLTSQLYPPFKQTIPVLKVTDWHTIPAPKDPYVYRNY